MKFRSVQAIAFGCLRSETLELAPGFNVVFGPNEAGKSTWHAAMYAALCGMRRGPGISKEDREFRERYRPWDGDDWRVKARVELRNGTEYDLLHDLDAKVACSVTDAATGKDISNTVMFEGAPDGSMWLSLNRRLFLHVACIRQADILGILESANVLQEQLQRAVASPEAKATAAAALQRIRDYRKEKVGLDRKNSSRPLAVAGREVKRLAAGLVEARRAHEEYSGMLETGGPHGRTRSQAPGARGRLSSTRNVTGTRGASQAQVRNE